MKPRVLPLDMSAAELRQEIFHTIARLRAYPFLVSLVAPFETLLRDLATLSDQELALELERLMVEARVLVVDEGLDYLCRAIAATLDALTGGDRGAPIYLRYFKNISPSKLRRPVLGVQLATMSLWVPSLTGEETAPALREFGAQLGTRVAEAEQVERGRSEVQRKRADFVMGPRKAFIDRLNAQRQALYGQLAEMAHGRLDLNLPSGFATPFFIRETRRRYLDMSELEQRILSQREALQELEDEMARRLADEERAEEQRMAQELAEAEEELAEAEAEQQRVEQQRAELTARVAALRGKKSK